MKIYRTSHLLPQDLFTKSRYIRFALAALCMVMTSAHTSAEEQEHSREAGFRSVAPVMSRGVIEAGLNACKYLYI